MSEIAELNLRMKARITSHRLISWAIYLVCSRGSRGQMDPQVLLEKMDKE